MAKDSLEAWRSWKQAQKKYDYFIVSVTTALLAYLGGNFTPEPLAFSQNTFELISLTFLLISVVTGILRLESDLSIQSTNLRQVVAKEQLDVVNEILNIPIRNIDLDTGMEISLTEAKERQNILQEFISKAGTGLNKVGKKVKGFLSLEIYSFFWG